MFPTSDEIQNSQEVENNYKIYRGRYYQVLPLIKNLVDKSQNIEVVENIAGLATRIFADLMFLEAPKITMPDEAGQEFVDEFQEESELDVKLWESAIGQSYAGITGFELVKKDNNVYLSQLNPSTIFPQTDHMNAGKFEKIIIAWKPKIDGKEHLFQKIHTKGLIEYMLNEIEGNNKLGKSISPRFFDERLPSPDADGVSRENTGIDKMICFVINNQKTGQEAIGISDYDDITSLLTELTRLNSQLATQLKKHANAMLAVPQGILDEKGQIRNTDLEMIEVSSSDNGEMLVPQYIQQSLKIQELQNDIIAKIEAIARVMEVSALLIDIKESGGAEKVGALKLRMLRTLAKTKRKLKNYRRQLKQIISTAYQWETGKKIEPTEISIKFFDGLPEDYEQAVINEATRFQAGLQTLRDAIKTLDKLDGEALNEKIAQIEEAGAFDVNNFGTTVPAVKL